jgi:hypothetical protein
VSAPLVATYQINENPRPVVGAQAAIRIVKKREKRKNLREFLTGTFKRCEILPLLSNSNIRNLGSKGSRFILDGSFYPPEYNPPVKRWLALLRNVAWLRHALEKANLRLELLHTDEGRTP